MKRLTKLFTNNKKCGKISIGKSDLTGNNIWFADVEDFLSSNNEWKILLDENQYKRILISNDKDDANSYIIGYTRKTFNPKELFIFEGFDFVNINTNEFVCVIVKCEIEKDGDYSRTNKNLDFYVFNGISENFLSKKTFDNISLYSNILTKDTFFEMLNAPKDGI